VFCYFFGAYSPKNYLYVDDKLKTNIKKKGVPKQALHVISYEDYKDKASPQQFIDSIENFYLKGLGSKKHEISLDVILKKIKNIDTKRVIIDPQHTNAKGFSFYRL
jgi:hypothetical protein